MAVNNTLSVKEYALGTTATSFPITFEFTTDDNGNAENIHCQRAEKNDEGQYIESEELAEGLAGDFTVSGGNVNYIDDATQEGKYLIIYRSTPVSQLTDFIDNGNYSLEDIEKALDKLTFILQERTGTPVGTYINVGVSLFFASILKLTNKKDFLKALFSSWNDIPDEDKPGVAADIRTQIDAVSKTGDETIQGHKTFTYSPVLNNDPQTDSDATRKSYVDGQIAEANSYTDGKFPIGTSQIAGSVVTTAKIADGNVTTAKIADGAVTSGKLADQAVTYAKMRRGTATVTMTQGDDAYYGSWSNGGNKILVAVSAAATFSVTSTGGALTYAFRKTSSGNITVTYIY